jgi:hypothetical protein
VVPHEIGAEWLADERRAIGHVAGGGLDLTGRDYDRDVRSSLGGVARELEAVSAAWHLHVREQQLDGLVMLGEHVERLRDAVGLEHLKASFFEDAGRIHQDQHVVIDDERVRGRVEDRVPHRHLKALC